MAPILKIYWYSSFDWNLDRLRMQKSGIIFVVLLIFKRTILYSYRPGFFHQGLRRELLLAKKKVFDKNQLFIVRLVIFGSRWRKAAFVLLWLCSKFSLSLSDSSDSRTIRTAKRKWDRSSALCFHKNLKLHRKKNASICRNVRARFSVVKDHVSSLFLLSVTAVHAFRYHFSMKLHLFFLANASLEPSAVWTSEMKIVGKFENFHSCCHILSVFH